MSLSSYSSSWENSSIMSYRYLCLILICSIAIPVADAVNVAVGNDPTKFNFRWRDGACYLPIKNVRVGDTIEFNFRGHDVYKMKSAEAYDKCNFSPDNAEMLAVFGESPYKYTITKEDAQPLPNVEGEEAPSYRSLYFSCSIGAHCLGKQRIRVDVNIEYDASLNTRSFESSSREEAPVSKFVLGADAGTCTQVQNGAPESILDRFMESSCSEPKKNVGNYGRDIWSTSCLSPPFTLTPGGVINQATILHYPFPEDHRVVLGRRMWEFVQGDIGDLKIVNVNQLYVHHLLGGVVMGNGAESIRRKDEDAEFPRPYGQLSGEFDDVMTFHLIDLRETGDDWMACLECRCKRDTEDSLLGIGGSGGGSLDNGIATGGVSCCSNCTALTTPTIDYRMRYNVTWSEVEEEEPIRLMRGMTCDIASAIGKRVEWDVPQYKYLPVNQRLPEDPTVQVLERVGPMNELFSGTSFAAGVPEEIELVEIHRCAGHMHIGAIEAWVYNAETGDIICNGKAVYGKDPAVDKGFITSIETQDYNPPIVLAANTPVRVVTHYDATVLHTGVMGIFTIFYADHETEVVRPKETALTVDLCESKCDISLLPNTDNIKVCEDNLKNMYPCIALGVCDCDAFMNFPGVGGCGGDWTTARGSYPVELFCAEHCGCEQMNDEEEVKKITINSVQDRFTKSYSKLCHFATDDCKHYLSNLLSCSKELNENDLHPAVWEALEFQDGTRMALEKAKLGNDAIHRFNNNFVNEQILPCSNVNAPDSSSANALITDNVADGGNSSGANGFFIIRAFSIIFTLAFANSVFLF